MKIMSRKKNQGKGQADATAPFTGEEITNEMIDEVDERTLEICYDTAKTALDCLASNGNGIRRQCTTILGWMTAALASLIGVLVYNLNTDPEFNLVVLMSCYGILTIGIIVAYLIWTTQSGISTLGPGDRPSLPIRNEVLDCFEGTEFSPEKKYKFILGWYLKTMQKQYDDHTEVNHNLMIAYKNVLLFTSIAFVGGIALFGICLLVICNS